MKKTLLVFLFITSCSFYCSAQLATFMEWQKSLGGRGDDEAYSIKQTSDGGYIVAGASASDSGDVTGNHGSYDYWVAKLSNSGALIWQVSLGGSSINKATSIQQTSDGGYIVAGYTGSENGEVSYYHGGYDFWVVKLTGTGTISWAKPFGSVRNDYAYAIQQTLDGGYIVAGESGAGTGQVTKYYGGPGDMWIAKIDDDGDLIWQQSYGGTGEDAAYSIQQTTDKGYIIAGFSNSTDSEVTGNHGSRDMWVVKADSLGNLQWEKSYGGSGDDYAQSVQQTLDGGYIVAGYTNSTDSDITGNHGLDDYWVVKLDTSGNISWQKTLGGSGADEAYSIQQTNDGGYIVAGGSHSLDGDITLNHGDYDYWIVKLDATGNIQMEKSLGGSGVDNAQSLQQTSDGGFIVTGTSNSIDGDVIGNHNNTNDFWVVKLSAVIGIEEKNNPLSEFQISPNPTSQSATISFSLSQSENVSVKIYDVTGRQITNRYLPNLNQGMHNFTWSVNDNSGNSVDNGIYLVTVEIPMGSETKRVAVLK